MTGLVAVDEAGIVTRLSPRTVAATVARLTSLVIDQAAQAREAGLDLRETGRDPGRTAQSGF